MKKNVYLQTYGCPLVALLHDDHTAGIEIV